MNNLNNESKKERIRSVAQLLTQAAKPVRILKTIDWSPQVKAEFLPIAMYNIFHG